MDRHQQYRQEATLRPSARVRTVAKMLEWDQSQVRRAVESGALEAYRVGKRGVRIFIDSVRDYQEGKRIAPVAAKLSPAQSSNSTRISSRAHRSAMAELRARGIV